jgi:hypothetical protein
MGIDAETRALILAFEHDTITQEDLVARLESLERRAPLDFACQFTKAVAWARHGQTSMLVDQLRSIIADRRFQTRH